ncbi:TPA: ead/Ea22-like family protein [Serratia marcescens]|nr:ead/Ea22-like family protein [Serratia marcescens]
MNTDKLSELKAAAMAATPGPWGINRIGNTIASNQSHPVATVSDAFHRQLAGGGVGNDAEFIAAVNPAVVLELLAELEAKDKALELEREKSRRVMSETHQQAERITWLESISTDYISKFQKAQEWIAELEAKLATPVRLQSPWVDKVGNRWLLEGTTADVIRAAGFKIEGED